jgi:hypothetical protein
VSGPYDVGHHLHLVVLAVTIVGAWVVRSIGAPRRRPAWLVALVAVGLVVFVAYAVFVWFDVPPVRSG